MSLMDEIKKYKKENKKQKADILLGIKDEIQEMILIGIPIKKQIELILSNTEIEKLQYAEYYNILKKHFGYKGKNKNRKVFVYSSIDKKSETTKKRNATDILSEDVDLLDMHLSKQDWASIVLISLEIYYINIIYLFFDSSK